MIEVFATDVRKKKDATVVKELLLSHFPEAEINFDLDDCDKILRIEDSVVKAEQVRQLLFCKGFKCVILE